MSATPQQSDDPLAARDTSALALVVELDAADHSAMVRVLTLLARRRCIVLHAVFAPDPEGSCNLLRMELEAPRHLRDNLAAWVTALVPVRSVHVRSQTDGQAGSSLTGLYEPRRRKRLAASA